MKSQDEKIKQLEAALTLSHERFNDLSASVKTIEYNIQGFEIVDDEATLSEQRSRPGSHVDPGKKQTPRPMEHKSRLRRSFSNIGTAGGSTAPGGEELDQNKYEMKVNVGEQVVITEVPTQPTIPELSSQPHSPRPASLKSSPRHQDHSPRPHAPDPLDLVTELISQAKENPSYHSSRNVSPRTSNAVIYPLPPQEMEGLISNLPSHDHLDDAHMSTFPSEPTPHDPLLSPSGTSVSSLTFATHHQQPQHWSPPESPHQQTDSPRLAIQNELNDLHQTLQKNFETEEEDDFDLAMKGLSLLHLNKPLFSQSSPSADAWDLESERRPKAQIAENPPPVTDLKSPPVVVMTAPSVDLTNRSSVREENPKPLETVTVVTPVVEVENNSPPTPTILHTPSTDAKKRRKMEIRPEDIEAGKKGVGRSKLDPKMTVNNRLRALEDTIVAMSDIVNAHHRALDAIPMRLKKAVPTDLIVRLANVLDQLETPLSSQTQMTTVVKTEPLSDEMVETIIERVITSLPQPEIASRRNSEPTVASDDEIKFLAQRMIAAGCFDEFKNVDSSRSRSGRGGHIAGGTEIDEDDELITKGELSQLFDDALDPQPLQITIPSSAPAAESLNELHSPIMNPSPSPSLLRSFPTDESVSVGHSDLKSLSNKLQHMIATQIQHNALSYVTRDDLEASLQSSYSHFETEIQKQIESESSQRSVMLTQSRTSSQDDHMSEMNATIERTNELEKTVGELQHLVNSLEITLKKHISSSFLKDKLASQENTDQAWRPEIEKINENILKSMSDHKELAKALLVDLQQLQKDILNRVDEQRLTSLLQEIDSKIQQQIIEGVDPVNNSIATIIRAVKHKADRKEMERLVLERITQTEETIRKIEDQQIEQENHFARDLAGGVRCLSCGSIGKGGQASSHVATDELSFERNSGGDYNQLLAVLNRQAGLKPLARQMKPLVPMTPISRPASSAVVSPIMKKNQSQEPLYRRAKAVSMMKEIPKIPMVSFGPSAGSQASDLYHFDHDQSLASPSSVNSSSSSINSRVRLPRVPSTRSSGAY